MVLADACAFSSSPTNCSLVYYGVLSKGLQAAVLAYVTLVQELLALVATDDFSATGAAMTAQVRVRCCEKRVMALVTTESSCFLLSFCHLATRIHVCEAV